MPKDFGLTWWGMRWLESLTKIDWQNRAYRIGQHSNVLVTRFVTSGTFEERIDRMLTEKKHLADLTVASGESWIGRLSDSELKELVSYSDGKQKKTYI